MMLPEENRVRASGSLRGEKFPQLRYIVFGRILMTGFERNLNEA